MHLSHESLFDLVLEQSAPLRHQLSELFSKFRTHHYAQSMLFEEQIIQMFHQLFSLPLPTALEQQALYEKKLVQSIRKQLKEDHLILRRTADQQNMFYLMNAHDFEQQCQDYLQTTDLFQLVDIIDEKTNGQVQQLDKIVQMINSELKTMHESKHLKKEQLENLLIDRSRIEFPYLYFLPEITKNYSTNIQPFMSCSYSPINKLANFLDQLLRPLVSQCTIFRNGADFIRQLDTYTKSVDHFHSRKLLATFKILNFSSLLSHDHILDSLGRFLTNKLAHNRLDNLSIITIENLTELFLKNNSFYYQEKIYRYRKGSPNDLSFTETLENIFFLEWQLCLLKNPLMKNEFYGRYKNMAFLTYSGTSADLREILLHLNQSHVGIEIESSMGTHVNFLNIDIENRHGQLYTSVYHDPNVPSYVLPYMLGHVPLIYCHYFRAALIRAVQYCSHVDDFDQERLSIELAFLTHGFPLKIIESYLDRFFHKFKVPSLRTVLDQTVYHQLRNELLARIDQQQALLNKNQQLEKNHHFFRLYYLYEWGPRRQFNKKFQELWSHSIAKYPMLTKNLAKINLNTKYLHSLKSLLAREKPMGIISKKRKMYL